MAGPPLFPDSYLLSCSSEYEAEPPDCTYRILMCLAKRHPIWTDQTEEGMSPLPPPRDADYFTECKAEWA